MHGKSTLYRGFQDNVHIVHDYAVPVFGLHILAQLGYVMLRSHLERGLAEFVELKIWASSESLSGFGRALCDSHILTGPSVHLQDRSRPKSERVVADSGRSSTQYSTNLKDIGLAPSGERHKLDRTSTGPSWMHVPLESSGKVASLDRTRSTWVGGELPEKCKIVGKARSSLTPPEGATRSERFLNFERGPTVPRTSLQIPRRIC